MFIEHEIYVFRTDVRTRRLADRLCKNLEKQGLAQRATVDLDDCDKVLRVETRQPAMTKIQALAAVLGVKIEELD